MLPSGAQPVLQACIQHSFLPPVDVELSLHSSGTAAAAQGDYRSLVVQVSKARLQDLLHCCWLRCCKCITAHDSAAANYLLVSSSSISFAEDACAGMSDVIESHHAYPQFQRGASDSVYT
jgi:hypothetical protein